MFAEWLQQGGASWNQLLEALRSNSVEETGLANRIKQMLDNENDDHGKEIIANYHGSV